MPDGIQIQYGRVRFEDKICGYCTWNHGPVKIELVSEPYGRLRKFVNGKEVEPSELDIVIWARVADWLGSEASRCMDKTGTISAPSAA